jgi:hypothetical protein
LGARLIPAIGVICNVQRRAIKPRDGRIEKLDLRLERARDKALPTPLIMFFVKNTD